MKLEDIIARDIVLELATLKADQELVKQLQEKLCYLGLYPALMIDGVYGQSTEAALIKFCLTAQLNNMTTGKFGRTFAEKLMASAQLPNSKLLSEADYQRSADLLGVKVAAIRAVVEIEAAGAGFLADGRPKILFERHWFYQLTPLPVSQTRPDLSNLSPGGYLGGDREWERLNDAIKFDRIPALKSASWGLGQVMGFNHKLAGYDDIEAFVTAMYQSEGKQMEAMMTFIKNNNGMASALRRHDWKTFAQFYNGPRYWVNKYDEKLAKAFARFENVAVV